MGRYHRVGNLLRELGLYDRVNGLVDRVEAARRPGRSRGLYRSMFAPGELVFDIGANLGDRAALFLELGARVVCVEPLPANAERLERRFAGEPRATVLALALGAEEGEGELRFSPEATNIASLSAEWVEAVRGSERLRDSRYHWERSCRVALRTLDSLIAEHGEPVFAKIDVEGYEPQVLRGLSRPLRGLSLEFTPERAEASWECLARLAELGDYEFNYSHGESMRLTWPRAWVGGAQLREALERLRPEIYGDIFARRRG